MHYTIHVTVRDPGTEAFTIELHTVPSVGDNLRVGNVAYHVLSREWAVYGNTHKFQRVTLLVRYVGPC